MRKPATDLVLSEQGAAVIAEREGLRTTAYRDERGILTIGIGHTSAAGPPEVIEGQTITEAEAYEIFRADNKRFRDECLKLVRSDLHQHEFDSLASFIFNLGSTQFAGSTVLKRLNAGDYDGVPDAMMMWVTPSSIASRRRGEVEQFTNANYVARA
jgi:lysozyme